jgi:error-prone DNA polymerase
VTYAALWTKSNFSFLEGASHPDELVEAAHRHGLAALALTDRDGVYGAVRAHVKARELGLALIHGAQLTLEDGAHLLLLAQSRAGYAHLCGLITAGRMRSPKGSCSITWSEVCAQAGDLIALWDLGRDGPLDLERERRLEQRAGELRAAFGDRLYGLCARRQRADEASSEGLLRARAARWRVALAAANEVLYHRADRRRLQDVLTAIRHGVALSKAGRRLAPNAEHELKSPHAFEALFGDDRAALECSREIAARCNFRLDQVRYRYPSERLPDGQDSSQWLRKLVFDGARARYGGQIPEATLAQLERELELIEELDYGGYFLTMHEIVQFCRSHSILCQGRGSAANSAVCYCLGVTAIDPVRMGLLFERFLSRERAEPPDIDLDIEHERREEVIQHVYDKYGRTHAAMVANVIRYRARSAVRDVGKALSFPESMLTRLTRVLSHGEGLSPRVLKEAGLDPQSEAAQQLSELCQQIEDFPRHLSIHPGGFLLGHEPIATLVPVENASMADRTVIQWDKDDVEAIGLFKVDLLGLGALHHLHRCFDLLREHHGLEFSMASLPADDTPTFDAICRGDTVGVFQIESRAQMAMLPRLAPRNYYDLVIEVSIVRPGPITGGMVHPYLRRRRGLEPVEYPHECLRPVLEKTLGVPLFQEQVMKLAMVAADYTPGEADQLRRDMAAWRKSGRMGQHRDKLVSRMTRKGIQADFAERVFQQICGFGEYGFPESHAASFALISYAGAWLKCHYPTLFACALINAQPMGFYTVATILEDAQRHGVRVLPVDVLRSSWDCTLEAGAGAPEGSDARFALRMGLRTVKTLTLGDYHCIEQARNGLPTRAAARTPGAWEARDTTPSRSPCSLADFDRRSRLDRRALMALAEAGALEGFEDRRRSALWKARGLSVLREPWLFDGDPSAPQLANLSTLEEIDWDYRSKGHSAHGHPLGPLREQLRAQKLKSADQLSALGDKKRVKIAGLVICRQRPGTASGVTFMTLEDETGFVNVVVWPSVFERHEMLLKTQNFLGVTGRLQVQDGVTHLIADRLWKPEVALAPPETPSRDFH